MYKKIIGLFVLLITFSSCQFTEKMELHEDGTGRMAIEMDLSEMLAFAKGMPTDSALTKKDTIISFKKIFEEKKDSIAKLSKAEQKKLKEMEKYNLELHIDPENEKMKMGVFVNFKSVDQANDLMQGFSQVGDKIPGTKTSYKDGETNNNDEILGVRFFYKKNRFRRDAYIKNEKNYQQQLDSLKDIESFIGKMNYTVIYTFPKPIKKSSVTDAVYSADKKTITITRSFAAYYKNPDTLDIEIELEK